MAISPDVFKEAGLTEDKLKAKFTSVEPSEKIKALKSWLKDVIQAGVDQNLDQARIFYAIDKAYEIALRQTTSTLIEHLINNRPEPSEILNVCKSLGLTHTLTAACGGCGSALGSYGACPSCKSEVRTYQLETPFLNQIYIPIVAAVVKRRAGSLFNMRDTSPHYSYSPLRNTAEERLKCEIIQGKIDRTAQQMGYRADRRQALLQACLYGYAVAFPKEDWYREVYPSKNKKEKRVIKEGLRNAFPHPNNMFLDPAHRPSTVNSDTGCAYGGFWEIVRWGDIDKDQKLWNKDKVSYNGSTFGLTSIYWKLYPCVMKFPNLTNPTSDNQRQYLIQSYATGTEASHAFIRCNIYAKLVPKEWDLGDLDVPVWFRFMTAGADEVMWCSPLSYSPMVFYGLDLDENRAFNPSLALDALPFQDHTSNIFTQMITSVKSNLMRIVFYDKDVIKEKTIDEFRSRGDKKYRELTFVPYSKADLSNIETSINDSIHSIQIPQQSIMEGLTMVNSILNIMDRVLQVSAQETGGAATHEQSAQELRFIGVNQAGRTKYLNSWIDDAEQADKRRQYDAMMAYGSDKILTEIGALNDAKVATLKKLGFEIDDPATTPNEKAGVSGLKSNLVVDSFAVTKEVDASINHQMATAIMQLITGIAANPALLQALGEAQVIEWINYANSLAGMPREFKLRATESAPKGEEMVAMMAQVAQKVSESTSEQFGMALKEKIIDPMQQAIAQAMQAIQSQGQQVGQAVQGLQAEQQTQAQAITRIAEIIQQAAAPAPPIPVQPYEQQLTVSPDGDGVFAENPSMAEGTGVPVPVVGPGV